MNDIEKLDLVKSLVENVIDVQNWFSANGKVSAILANRYRKIYGQTRKFLWAPGTCFVEILLFLKQFKRMKGGMRTTVWHDAYKNLNFMKGEAIDGRVTGRVLWTAIGRVLLYICASLLM